MKWMTKQNGTDCGVFLMRHMETFNGLDGWNCGLEREGKAQMNQLRELRSKYAVKIITHEINEKQQEVMQRYEDFERAFKESEKRQKFEESQKLATSKINEWDEVRNCHES